MDKEDGVHGAPQILAILAIYGAAVMAPAYVCTTIIIMLATRKKWCALHFLGCDFAERGFVDQMQILEQNDIIL